MWIPGNPFYVLIHVNDFPAKKMNNENRKLEMHQETLHVTSDVK